MAACTPSGGSTKGAVPSPVRKSAVATTATARSTLAVMVAATSVEETARASGAALALHADHSVGGQSPQEVGDRLLHQRTVLGLQRDLDLVLRVGELRVRAEQQVGMDAQQVVQVLGERALADP